MQIHMEKIPEALPPSEVLPRQLADIRMRKKKDSGRRSWSQEDLANRLTALGLKIDQSAISRIEAGEREVSIDELFYLAAALGVSPLHLMVPTDFAEVRITPKVTTFADDARAWIRGQDELRDDHYEPYDHHETYWQEVPEQEKAAFADPRFRALWEWVIRGALDGVPLDDVMSWLEELKREDPVKAVRRRRAALYADVDYQIAEHEERAAQLRKFKESEAALRRKPQLSPKAEKRLDEKQRRRKR
jgi:transcriptional regulator with XRE-family HTH domain